MTAGNVAAAPAPAEFASFDVPVWVWGALVAVIVVLLLIDLLLVHRTPHVISFREAAAESAVWVTLGIALAFVMLWWQGGQAAGEYFAGYLIEKSLSVDNVFVWAVLFSYFAVPPQYQFRVLFWDQYDNAQRLQEAGFGARLPTYDWEEDELIATVERLLGDEELQARMKGIAAEVQAEPGNVKGAELIERLALTGEPATA